MAVALAVRLPFLFGSNTATPGGDSAGYLALAHSLADGMGFSDEAYRTVGYPVFLAGLEWLPGRVEDAAVVLQHLLGVGLVGVMLMVTNRLFGLAPALLASSLAALTPALVYLEHALLTDFLFGLVIFLGAVALARAANEPEVLRWAVITGVVFGLATHLRPVGQWLVFAGPLALAYARPGARRVVVASLVITLTFLVTIAPWITRNAIEFGRPTMSVISGDTLFARAFEVDGLPVPTDTENGRIVAARIAALRPGERPVSVAQEALRRSGLSRLEAIEAEGDLARRAITRSPLVFTHGTFRETSLLVVDARRVGRADDPRNDTFLRPDQPGSTPVPAGLSRVTWRLSDVVSGAWWLLSLHGLAGVLALLVGSRRSRNAAAALLAVWVTVALGTAIGRGALTRYAIELAPLTWVLGSVGVVVVVTGVKNELARWRQAPQDGGSSGSTTPA